MAPVVTPSAERPARLRWACQVWSNSAEAGAETASTANAGNPHADQHGVSIGFDYRCGKATLDGFYTADFFPTRRVESAILSGKYNNLSHFIGISLGWAF